MFVERVFLRARWIIWDDGQRALFGDGLAEIIGVVGGVGHEDLGGQPLDQGTGLRRIALLPGGQGEPDRTAQASDSQVDLGAQTAT